MREQLTLLTQNPVEALQLAERLPAKSVLFVQYANRVLEAGGALPALQAVWNLRDTFKANKRTLVLLGPSLTLPPELSGDVIAYDEPLPDGERLRAIVTDVYRSARLDPPAGDVEARAIDALSGLSAFTAEQVTAMSLTPLDEEALAWLGRILPAHEFLGVREIAAAARLGRGSPRADRRAGPAPGRGARSRRCRSPSGSPWSTRSSGDRAQT